MSAANQITIQVSSPLAGQVETLPFTLSEEVETYNHTIKAIGGYDTANITINDNQANLEDWLLYGLGKHIEVYNPDLEIIWEGFIDKIEVTLGPLQFSIGPLLDIGNSVRVVYTPKDNTTDPPTTGVETLTSFAGDTNSQNIYGIIQKVLSGNSAKDETDAENIRDKWLNDPAGPYPATSRQSNLTGSSGPNVTLSCLGYWHWLTTYYPDDTTSGNIARSDKIENVLADEPNGIFSTDYSQIETNTDTIAQQDDLKKTAQTILLDINKTGISSNRSLMGFYANRRFEYSSVPTDFVYVQRLSDNRGVTDKLNTIIPPWNIKPGQWIFYSDLLVGGAIPSNLAALQTDLRSGFIETVRFDAPYGASVDGVKLDSFGLFLEKLNLKNGGV